MARRRSRRSSSRPSTRASAPCGCPSSRPASTRSRSPSRPPSRSPSPRPSPRPCAFAAEPHPGEKRDKAVIWSSLVLRCRDTVGNRPARPDGAEMMMTRTTTVVAAASALGLAVGGLAVPAALGAPAPTRPPPATRAAATAPFPLSFEFVSTWGTYGAGFGKHIGPAGISAVGDQVYVADAGSHSIEVVYPGGGTIYNSSEIASSLPDRFYLPYDV